jgi:hypothetical protein
MEDNGSSQNQDDLRGEMLEFGEISEFEYSSLNSQSKKRIIEEEKK